MTGLNVCNKVDVVSCLVGALCAGVLGGLNQLGAVSDMAHDTPSGNVRSGNSATALVNNTLRHDRGGGLHWAGGWPSIFFDALLTS